MTKTQHYQLNQWDPEDRILRVDFNADNAAADAALKANADAISGEAADRKSAITAVRADFAAADDTLRSEFAAADETLRSENKLVRLRNFITTVDCPQVNVSMSNLNLSQYAELIILPQIKVDTAGKLLLLRINNMDTGYYHGTELQNYFCYFYPTHGYSSGYGSYFAKMCLYPAGENLAVWSSYGNTAARLPASRLAVSAVQTLNFVSPSATILSGSRISIYGVKL